MFSWVVIALLVGAGLYLFQHGEELWQANQRALNFRWSALWRTVAAEQQLTAVEEPDFGEVLLGRAGEVQVRLERYRVGNKDYGAKILVKTPDTGVAGVQVRGEDLGTTLDKVIGRSDLTAGDADFDGHFFLGGRADAVLAFLDADMRRRLAELRVAARVEIIGGAVRVEIQGDSPFEIGRALRLALEVAREWPAHYEVAERLSRNAREDREAGVRLNNLLALLREFPNDAATPPALKAACADASPEIRLRAAAALGRHGDDTLLAMAEGPEDAYAARAIEALGAALDPARARAILESVLEAGRLQAAQACLVWLGRHGGEAGETPLLEALRHSVFPLRVAAATSLGQVGSVRAVEALKAAAEEERELRPAVRQAVAAIQSRVPGASPGQMSLTEDTAGRLTVAPHEPGQVSLTEGDAARRPGSAAVSRKP